jgi:ABC-2 type transport system ATP-binding protein
MKVAEQVVYLGRLHGLSAAAAKRNTTELLERLDLAARADDTVEKLSLGNQQRVQVCAALVHDPELLILDEPFSGLDPLAIETVLKVLQERAARGVPVLFSSHQLDLVERLCDDLIIISGGAIAAGGSRDELRARYATPRFELVVEGDAGWVRDQPAVTVVELDGARVVFDVANDADAQPVLREAISRGAVHSFGKVMPSLAEIFREVI